MLRDRALNLLRAHSPYGVPLENHCLRLGAFARAISEKGGVPFDEDLMYAACFLHDIGLCVKDPSEKNYLKRGLKFARSHIWNWDLSDAQRRVFEDVMLYSHALRTIPGITPGGELVRLAVRVEHSLGTYSHGLDKDSIRQVFDAYPRRGFNRVLLAFARTAVLEDGPTELVRVFFPECEA
ncbi:MAG: HD domain-containing protein [Myxococcota bacterium]|nr:HD domain-containing protein [Myxococcota bacterium]